MNIDDFIDIRQHLHKNPELSGNEFQTSKFVTSFLKKNCPKAELFDVGTTGVLAKFGGNTDTASVLLRCELDALAITETNNFPHRSSVDKVSHKCGHDGHMVIMLRCCMKLTMSPPKGDVFILFQPAEENGSGALNVLNDPTFQKYCHPDYVFALHNIPGEIMHSVLLKYDTFSSAVISTKVRFFGKTAHAGEPHKGLNPSIAISKLIQETKIMMDRFESAVITPIYTNIGSADFGISAGYGETGFTMRAGNNELLEKLRYLFLEKVSVIEKSHGINTDLEWLEDFPSINNELSATDFIRNSAKTIRLDLQSINDPFSWGEDFGHFTKKYKGAMFGLGAGIKTPALHNPDYDFPDELITSGSDLFIEIIHNVQNG